MSRRILKSLCTALCCLLFFVVVPSRVRAQDGTAASEEFDLRNNDEAGNESERDLYPQTRYSGLCRKCSCPRIPVCEAGVSLVVDGCGCCKVCARQLGEECNQRDVCDPHRGLHCDGSTGRCKARPGRRCYVRNKWYENGELFSPSCRMACSCIDGNIGCMSKCKPAPPGCANPRLVRTASNCCGKWRCSSRPKDFVSGKKDTIVFRGSCMIQTTEWSPCSTTCGFGLSERVTNDNENCKLTKETRLCNVRSCEVPEKSRKTRRSCRKTTRHKKRVQFSLSGCLTTKTYRPRYCGTCAHANKCCKPNSTKTIEMEFRCDADASEGGDGRGGSSGYVLKRKMMWIQSCVCGDFCHVNENDLFLNSFRGLGSDTWRSS